jgi:hypothetical protein
VPTSVLLAVLAAAGLLALAPALVRRYDATERLVAERAQSTARVLDRTRRRRTVPVAGRPLYLPAIRSTTHDTVILVRPTEATRAIGVATPLVAPIPAQATPAGNAIAADLPVSSAPPRMQSPVGRAVWVPVGRGAPTRGRRPGTRTARPSPRRGVSAPPARRKPGRARQSPAVYRRRRTLAMLVVLNIVELIGVFTVSSGFWTGFAVTALLLVGYVVHLRNSSIADAKARRVEARQAAIIATRQAEVRAEHARRIAARREALRRAAAARSTAQRDAQRISQRYVDHDPQRGGRVRGRRYDTGQDHAAGF